MIRTLESVTDSSIISKVDTVQLLVVDMAWEINIDAGFVDRERRACPCPASTGHSIPAV